MAFGQGAHLFELLTEKADAEAAVGAARGRLAQVEKAIAQLTQPAVDAALAREGQPAGTVKFAIDNHIFKAVIDKRVDWDSEILRELARELPAEDAEAIFKVKLTVPETVFKSILNPGLKARLTCARTVKYSEPKISLAD